MAATRKKVMTASILCPGPGLLKLTGAQWSWDGSIGRPDPRKFKADITIAVNRSILFVQTDWWLFLDKAAWREMRRSGCPWLREVAWCTTDYMFEDCKIKPKPKDFVLKKNTNDLKLNYGLETKVIDIDRGQSMAVAIAFACDLGARKINVFGADFEGSTYFDGKPCVHDNSRWQRLAEAFEQTVSAHKKLGIRITRK
jgi:hypothetical protein